MRNLKIFKLHDEAYQQDYILAVGDVKSTCKYLKKIDWGKKYIKLFKKTTISGCGVCANGSQGGILIWLPTFDCTPFDIGVLFHELMHAYTFLARVWDFKIKMNHKDIAYLERLLREFLEKLSKEYPTKRIKKK